MDAKQFRAILAKNNIARELADFRNAEGLNVAYVLSLLEDIESYVGTANQPSAKEIFEHNINNEKTFEI